MVKKQKTPKYPQSRLNLALETAYAVREIADILEDQTDISSVLINLACHDAFGEMGLEYRLNSQTQQNSEEAPQEASQEEPEANAHFGFNTKEVRSLEDYYD